MEDIPFQPDFVLQTMSESLCDGVGAVLFPADDPQGGSLTDISPGVLREDGKIVSIHVSVGGSQSHPEMRRGVDLFIKQPDGFGARRILFYPDVLLTLGEGRNGSHYQAE